MSAILSSAYSPASLQFILGGQPQAQAYSIDKNYAMFGAPTDVMVNNVLNGNLTADSMVGSLLQSTTSLISSIKTDMAIIMSNPANLRAPAKSANPFATSATGGFAQASNPSMDIFKLFWEMMQSKKADKASETKTDDGAKKL